MIKQAIQDINDIVITSNKVERYGKYCTVAKGSKGVPFGYGLEADCVGNTYTFDERHKNVAFLELAGFGFENINSKYQYLVINFKLHHFLNIKFQDIEKYYGAHLELFYHIKNELRKKWLAPDLNMNPSLLKIDNCEYSVMAITIKSVVGCDYVPDLNPDECIEFKQ